LHNPSKGGGWRENLAVGCALILLAWLSARSDHASESFPLRGDQTGYYQVLVKGFVAGRTSFEAEADPRLLSADPQVRAQSPVWQDAASYQGKHNLYYGVVPAVLVMLPYRLLTGSGMGDSVVILVGVALGFLTSVLWWRDLCRRYFSGLGAVGRAAVVGVLAIGPGGSVLLVRAEFYEIPIAWAYACAMFACWCSWRAWHTTRPSRWLAGAGLSLALAAGCRPEFVLGLPSLAWLAWLIVRRDGDTWRRGVRLALAAAFPALLVGLGLGLYNFARSGDFFETGFKYGINEFFTTGDKLMSVAFLWANFRWYFLTPPSFSPYFPFVYPMVGSFRPAGYHGEEAMHGQMAVTLLLIVAAVVIALNRQNFRWRGGFGAWVVPLFLTGVNLVFLCLLGIKANRYAVDPVAPLLLLVIWMVAEAWVRAKRGERVLLLTAMAWVMVVNVGAALQQFHRFANIRPLTNARLAKIFNAPAHWAERCGWMKAGPVRFTVMLPQGGRPGLLPLVTAGMPHYADVVYVDLRPDRRAQLVVLSQEHGEVRSELFPYDPGEPATFEIQMGSLYPPAGGPFFAEFEPYDVIQAKSKVRVRVNGVERLNAWMNLNESPPWNVTIAKNDTVYLGPFMARQFPSAAEAVARVPVEMERSNLRTSGRNGLWRLAVSFPTALGKIPWPVLTSGRTGKGNMLFVTSPEPGVIRFGLDYWGVGADESPPITVGTGSHRLELFVGPAAALSTLGADVVRQGQADALHLWLDGKRVWSVKLKAHLDTYREMTFGVNLQGFSPGAPYFPGDLRALPDDEAAVAARLGQLPRVP
jgi:hypothetical protein